MVVDKLKTDVTLTEEQNKVLLEAGYDVTRLLNGKKLVLITGHRRENFGSGFIRMVTAMKDLSEKYTDVDFVYPMHLNPNVREPIHEVFGGDLTRPNFFFIEPLRYLEFVHLMSKANIVLTDSGGIQEEAPALGKPVLVMRDTTERPEALVLVLSTLSVLITIRSSMKSVPFSRMQSPMRRCLMQSILMATDRLAVA